MSSLFIQTGSPLKGVFENQGSKNAALLMLASSLLLEEGEGLVISGVPNIGDIHSMLRILKNLGVSSKWSEESLTLTVVSTSRTELSEEASKLTRYSLCALGPVASRRGACKIGPPGGCPLGERPFDIHLSGFQSMGFRTSHRKNIRVVAETPKRSTIPLRYPTVTGTANLMMAASILPVITKIQNASKEPEICSLAGLLNKMGANVQGAGTPELKIFGVKRLSGASVVVPPDRIIAGTFILSVAVTHGDVSINNCTHSELEEVIKVAKSLGANVGLSTNSVRVTQDQRARPLTLSASPYPGFPTDLQPILVTALSLADGDSAVSDTVFTDRFDYVPALRSMGADIRVSGNTADIRGVLGFMGGSFEIPDIRAGAALILAGLAANESTVLTGVEMVDRGYPNLCSSLQGLGAKIARVN